MSTCICVLKSGLRKGQRCYAVAKVGQLCGRHANCANMKPIPTNSGSKAFHEVTFTVNYARTNKKTTERDPSKTELERYIAASRVIPDYFTIFDGYIGILTTSKVHYIGKNSFYFTCESDYKLEEIAKLFKQGLSDSVYEAAPGNGSFVYPTKNGMDELGLLYFESIVIDGKKFNSSSKKKPSQKKKPSPKK